VTPDADTAQVQDRITEDDDRSVRALVSADARMGDLMRRFLLRCLDKSPNTRPAAIDLMTDPWLTGVDPKVCTPLLRAVHNLLRLTPALSRTQGLRDFLQSPSVCADVAMLVANLRASNPSRDR
jgi:serine/threonine protein kinase